MTTLETARDVIKALGGPDAVARLFGVGYTAVNNWARANSLPPKTYLLISQKLSGLNHAAPMSLWDFAGSEPEMSA